MTKFELAVTATLNQTIKSCKPRDLKVLLELLDRHGAMPEADYVAHAAIDAEAVVEKLFKTFDRTYDIDPADREAVKRLGAEELQIVLGCSHCSNELRRRWSDPDYQDLAKRYSPTRLHSLIQEGP